MINLKVITTTAQRQKQDVALRFFFVHQTSTLFMSERIKT